LRGGDGGGEKTTYLLEATHKLLSSSIKVVPSTHEQYLKSQILVKIDTDSIGRCESDCLTITTMKPHVTTFVLSKYGTKYDPIIGLFVVFIIKAKRHLNQES
jgi:hypothetical protein